MFNLFRMEKYRALRSKVTIITIALANMIVFLNILLSFVMTDAPETFNICGEFTYIIGNPLFLILWAVAMSIYVAGEYKNGFVKSIAGQIPSKKILAVSKLYYGVIYSVAVFLTVAVVTAVSGVIFFFGNVTFGFEAKMLLVWIIQLLLHIAFSCIFILICSITRSSALGIGIGVFMSSTMTSMVYMGVNYVLHKIGIAGNFDISLYMIDSNMGYVGMAAEAVMMIRAAVVAVVGIVVLTYLCSVYIEKKDI